MTVPVTIRVDERALATLDELATGRQLSRERILESAVADFLAFEARQIAHIRQGIAAADQGEFGTEEDVDAVLRKYGSAENESPGPDPYLAYLDVFLEEWNSPEDAEAFDDL